LPFFGKIMKHIAVKKVFSYYYTDSDEIENCSLDEKMDSLDSELRQLFVKYGVTVAEGYTSFYGVDKYSIELCQQCGHLMINRDKNPAGLPAASWAADLEWVFSDGGTVDGKTLCERCLPHSHRWGHSS
jgi:hypothetical protein